MSQEKNKRVNYDVYESCYICGRDIRNINKIYVDIDSDNYVCQSCKKIHKIQAVKCAEI